MTVSPSTLGTRWPRVALDDAVEFLDHIRKPITASEREPGPYPYYGANGQQDSVANYLFDEPLILLAEDGGHFGDPQRGVAYGVAGKCWVNNHAHVLRPKPDFDFGFLKWHLAHYDLSAFVNGTTRGKLTKGAAERIPLVKPPLPEQRRIADILDKADAVRRKRKETMALTEELLRSAFLEMFGDIPAKRSPWLFAPFRPYLAASSGRSSKPVLSNVKTKIPVYGGNGINGWATRALYDEPVVVVGRVGQQCGITRMTTGPAWVTDNAIVVSITRPDKVNPVYLATALQRSPLRASVMRLDLPFINQGTILDYPLPLPPLAVQEQFAALRQRVLASQDTLRNGHQGAEELFASLVYRAFGEGGVAS